MELLLIYPKGADKLFDQVRCLADELSIPCTVFCSESDGGVRALLEKHWNAGLTHIILIEAENGMDPQWAYFALGYGTGTGNLRRIVMYSLAEKNRIRYPFVPFFSSETELKKYIIDEKHEFALAEKQDNARKRIIDAGMALSDAAFVECVAKGLPEFLGFYLEAGFSIDAVNENGVPLLHLAIRNRQHKTLLLLLSAGADINGIAGDNGNTPLMEGVIKEDEEIISELLKYDCNINIQNKNGQTALIIAVGNGYTGIAAALIGRKADISLADNLGMTAKKYAELFKNDKIAALLGAGLVS